MKSTALKFLTFLLLSSFIISCSKEDDGIYFNDVSAVETNAKTVTYTSLELEVLDLVNTHRADLGLNTLEKLDLISSVAEGHTNYMIEQGKASHDNFGQRSEQLMKNANAKTVGENVAYGYTTAESVVKGWLNSDTHRAVLENPNFTHFGISTELNTNERNFFTHIFIKK